MENLNQEITRNNIIDMRKSHNYSQKKLAELVGISRTIYNGIENGKVRITIFYAELLADFYNVPVEKIAVFSSSYDNGFYHGMQAQKKIDESEFDSNSMKIYQAEQELIFGQKFVSTLYPMLRAMGYTLEIMDLNECDPVKIPPDILKSCDNGKILLMKKENKLVAYWSLNDFNNFEHFITTTINGYLSELSSKTNEASKNPESKYFLFRGGQRISSSSKSTLFRPVTDKMFSREEKYFERRNIEELKENLKTYGIKDDEDSDE